MIEATRLRIALFQYPVMGAWQKADISSVILHQESNGFGHTADLDMVVASEVAHTREAVAGAELLYIQ